MLDSQLQNMDGSERSPGGRQCPKNLEIPLSSGSSVAIAQHQLGWMYRMGDGVPEDYVTAYAWASVAAATLAIDPTIYRRDRFKGLLTPSQLEKGEVMAREISERIKKRKAAKRE
jgi:hypothetical protein